MRLKKFWLGTVGSAAVLAFSCGAAWADTLAENPLIGTSGDGLIFSDPEEGVQPPGVKAVTFTSVRVPDSNPPQDGDPREVIIWDYTEQVDGEFIVDSRSDAPNCLMANNPGIFCDSPPGSGKRIKTQLTGPNPFDMTFQTTDAPYNPTEQANIDEFGAEFDPPFVDYFTFGKTSNYTGARITSFSLELLDADGNPMGDIEDAGEAVLFLTEGLDPKVLGGAGLPDGLFGEGGNEGEIGFFSDEKAQPSLTREDDVMIFGAVSSGGDNVYGEFFGDAFLDDTMVPDGLFWDDNGDPNDESSLVAWNNIGGGGWTYGTIALTEIPDDFPGSEEPPVLLPERLAELAATLNVEVADLNYVAGGPVPEAIVAAAEANGLFAVDAIEDLRNANLNFTMRIGELGPDGQFTLRINPQFAPIVTEAQSELQFKAAGYLDAAANVPYWDLGNASEYQTAIANILALDEAEQAAALTSTTFTISPAFTNLGLESGRNQVAALTGMAPIAGGDAGAEVAQAGGARSWMVGDGLYGLFSLGGSTATYDATSGSIGYDVSATSFTVGLERRLNAGTSAGLAIGASTGRAEAAGDLGEVEQTGISLAAFTRSQLANGASIQALFGYQDLSYDSSRSVLGETAQGSTNGSQIFGALKAEFLRDFGAFKVGPMASVEYYDVTVDGFTEAGADAFNLTVGEQSASTVVGSIGVAGVYRLPTAASDSVLTGSLAYTSVSGDDLEIESGFVGLPNATFPVQGLEQDLIDVSLGFESVLSSNAAREVVFSGGYGGAFGDNYERHGFQVGLNVQF